MVESGDEHCLNAASRILLVFKTPLADGIALYFSVPPAEFLSALAHLLGYCTLLQIVFVSGEFCSCGMSHHLERTIATVTVINSQSKILTLISYSYWPNLRCYLFAASELVVKYFAERKVSFCDKKPNGLMQSFFLFIKT